MAPEIYFSALDITDKPENRNPHRGFSTKSDVYSFSICFWELATRCFVGEYRTPFYSDNKNLQYDAAILIQVARKGLRPILKPGIPSALRTLIEWCWQQNPDARPNTEVILNQLKNLEDNYNSNPSIWNQAFAYNHPQ